MFCFLKYLNTIHYFDRKQFVDAYVNLAFNRSVEKVFEEFRRGFFKVCDRDVVELFQPEELRGVMVGKEDYDWDTLKQVYIQPSFITQCGAGC